ncbi:MAG: hypothetical protein A2Z88_08335 [Omnitrophica WOR_2 bacterium GWA2_47_8]|nr:MAG: hypothetical protein A2Z88_08335 [Omnitrophica WOR_2 bacterium GWA2_47_8]
MHLTKEPIEAAEFLSLKPAQDCGASACFFGWVRNHNQGRSVIRLKYECYEVLAEKEIHRIALKVRDQYSCGEVRILHRIGMIEVGEIAVAICASSAHRDEAFTACRAVIEEIKKKVPIWKKEVYADGMSEWVLCSHSVEGVP